MTTSNNIFFTSENFAFSLPLIALCAVYAYFKLIPIKVGVPILAVAGLFIKVRNDMKIKRADRAMDEVVDDAIMQELEKEEEWKTAKSKKAASKKQNKMEAKIRQRLKEEKVSENNEKSSRKKSKQVVDDDEDSLEGMITFVKGGRDSKKKK